jgi:hypothetical protein
LRFQDLENRKYDLKGKEKEITLDWQEKNIVKNIIKLRGVQSIAYIA